MAAPDWLRQIIAVAMIVVAAYHLSRLAMFRPARLGPVHVHIHVDVELTHVAMGSAMAFMVTDALAPADLRRLGLVFVVPVLWFLSRSIRSWSTVGLRAADIATQQVIACAAMAYMLLAASGPLMGLPTTGAMSGMAMSGSGRSALNVLDSPTLRASVVAAIVGLCVWTIARTGRRSADAGPVFGVGCQLAVNATTIYMLVAM